MAMIIVSMHPAGHRRESVTTMLLATYSLLFFLAIEKFHGACEGQTLVDNGTYQRDDRGVERSVKPFPRPPQLDINIRHDLSFADRSVTRLQKAMAMLTDDVRWGRNPLLLNAWNFGASQRPEYVADPVKLAAYVYSLAEPFYLYKEFNDAVSGFRDGSPYYEFHYKGFYALLLLLCRPYSGDLYRGIDTLVQAEKNTYIRFNRFSSASTNASLAMKFATGQERPGTLLVFKGRKNAAHIDPYSKFPDEDEYLISPDSQFRVIDIANIEDARNKGKKITLALVNYA